MFSNLHIICFGISHIWREGLYCRRHDRGRVGAVEVPRSHVKPIKSYFQAVRSSPPFPLPNHITPLPPNPLRINSFLQRHFIPVTKITMERYRRNTICGRGLMAGRKNNLGWLWHRTDAECINHN